MLTAGERTVIAQEFLTALRTRDWDLMRSLMTEDITWTLPGENLISGEARGLDAVIERAQRIVSYRLNFELKHMLFGGKALPSRCTIPRKEMAFGSTSTWLLCAR